MTMTDSELLDLAKAMVFEAEDTSTTDRAIYPLARFVADMLDDGPVTEEALRELAKQHPGKLSFSGGKLGRLSLLGTHLEFNLDVKGACSMWQDDYDTICNELYDVPNMSSLRCLLRGLGVMT